MIFFGDTMILSIWYYTMVWMINKLWSLIAVNIMICSIHALVIMMIMGQSHMLQFSTDQKDTKLI